MTRAPLEIILRNGARVSIVRAVAADAVEVLAFALSLSPDSRHNRFFAQIGNEALAAEMARELADPGNISLVARDASAKHIVGHALGARTESGAEIAFAVADDVQHLGLGTHLLQALLDELRDLGVRHFEAITLPLNTTMRKVFAVAGFTMLSEPYDVRADLDDDSVSKEKAPP